MVWAWGLNFFGQLGDGGTTNRLAPRRVGAGAGWASAAAAYDHTVAIRS